MVNGGLWWSMVVYGGLRCSPLLVPSPGRKCRFYWPAQANPHTRGVVPSPVRTFRRWGPARATSTSTDRRESARNPTHLEYLDELERSAALPSHSAQRQGHGSHLNSTLRSHGSHVNPPPRSYGSHGGGCEFTPRSLTWFTCEFTPRSHGSHVNSPPVDMVHT